MSRFRRCVRGLLLASCAFALVLATGCGGEEYEKRFNDSVKHLKDKGESIPRSGIPAPAPQPEGQQPDGKAPGA